MLTGVGLRDCARLCCGCSGEPGGSSTTGRVNARLHTAEPHPADPLFKSCASTPAREWCILRSPAARWHHRCDVVTGRRYSQASGIAAVDS
jgi:hypothetical protein